MSFEELKSEIKILESYDSTINQKQDNSNNLYKKIEDRFTNRFNHYIQDLDLTHRLKENDKDNDLSSLKETKSTFLIQPNYDTSSSKKFPVETDSIYNKESNNQAKQYIENLESMKSNLLSDLVGHKAKLKSEYSHKIKDLKHEQESLKKEKREFDTIKHSLSSQFRNIQHEIDQKKEQKQRLDTQIMNSMQENNYKIKKFKNWEAELKSREEWLNLQTKDMEILKNTLQTQERNNRELEYNLNKLIADKESQLNQKSQEITAKLQKEVEIMSRITKEKNELRLLITEYESLNKREYLLQDARKKLQIELEMCETTKLDLKRESKLLKDQTIEYEQKSIQLDTLIKDNNEIKVNLNLKLAETDNLYKEYLNKIKYLRSEEDLIHDRSEKLAKDEDDLKLKYQHFAEEHANQIMTKNELNELSINLKTTQANVELQMLNTDYKELELQKAKERVDALQKNLKEMEYTMSEERHRHQMEMEKQKLELQRMGSTIEVQSGELECSINAMNKERELMKVEQDTIRQSYQDLQNKQKNIDKMYIDIDSSKKTMNDYYESRIAELESKLMAINTEENRVLKSKQQYDDLEDIQIKLEQKEQELNAKENALTKEWTRLNEINYENTRMKDDIDHKVKSYKNLLSSPHKCTKCHGDVTIQINRDQNNKIVENKTSKSNNVNKHQEIDFNKSAEIPEISMSPVRSKSQFTLELEAIENSIGRLYQSTPTKLVTNSNSNTKNSINIEYMSNNLDQRSSKIKSIQDRIKLIEMNMDK